MSRINGEKARANVAKKRRTAMREKSRVARAATQQQTKPENAPSTK
jgi:hypothetical protein